MVYLEFFVLFYNEILGLDDFNTTDFEAELNHFKDYKKVVLSENDQVFEDLRYQNCYDFTDAEIIDKTKRLYENAKKGIYSFYNYPTIFHFITRFDNPLNLDKDQLLNELKTGIDLYAKSTPSFDKFLNRHFGFSAQDPDINYLNSLAEYAMLVNQNLYSDDQTKYSEEMFTSFKSNPAKFIEEYIIDEKKSKHYISIFPRFDAQETINVFLKSKNSCLHDFTRVIDYRYKHYFDGHDPDLDFLVKLKEGIEVLEINNLPVKKSEFNKLGGILDRSINTLKTGKKK